MDLTRSRSDGARASGRGLPVLKWSFCGLLSEPNREMMKIVPTTRLRKRKREVGANQLVM